MKCSMTGQEKGDLLIKVTAWTGLIVYTLSEWMIVVLIMTIEKLGS